MVPVRLEVGYPVASTKLNAGVLSTVPSCTDTPPYDTLLFAKFVLFILQLD